MHGSLVFVIHVGRNLEENTYQKDGSVTKQSLNIRRHRRLSVIIREVLHYTLFVRQFLLQLD